MRIDQKQRGAKLKSLSQLYTSQASVKRFQREPRVRDASLFLLAYIQ